MGRWYKAEECESDIGMYYLISGHICPVGEVEELGEYEKGMGQTNQRNP